MPAKKKTARKKVTKKVVAGKPPKKTLRKRHQPETLRLRTAGPSFTVNDIEKSLAWYRGVLGFTVTERWENGGKLMGAELLAGSVTFYIGQDDWKKGRDRAKGEGFRIYCTTVQDV